MTYTTLPAIAGTVIPRPNALDEGQDPVRTTVELASGALRAYSSGRRRSFDLTWVRATEETVNLLRSLTSPAFVAYRHQDGVTRIVETSGVEATPIAGTDPPRFSVSLNLREQVPST